MRRQLSFLLGLFIATLTTSVFAQSFSSDKVYTIYNPNDANVYMQDNGTGVVALGAINSKSYWKLIATSNANCYYVQNATTNKYMQSTSTNQKEVKTGDTPVEISIILCSAEGNGMYGIASTDQTTYDFTSGTIGANWHADGYVQGYAAVSGINHRSFWKIVEAATLKTSTGKTFLPGGDIYLYNVESGLWLQNNDSKSNDWSTRAAIGTRGLDFNVYERNGAYALNSKFSNGSTWSINPGNNYLDSGNDDCRAWTIEPKEYEGLSNTYKIYSGDKVLGTVKYNEGGKQNNLFTQEGDERWYLENPDYNVNMTERNTWQLVTREERLAKVLEEASETNPIDVSWLIPSADFANNDTRYNQWTRSLNGGNGRTGDGDDFRGSMCVESWNSGTIDFSITLNDIPNGIYHFNLQGFYRDGSGDQVVGKRTGGTETIRSFYFAGDESNCKPLKSILDNNYEEGRVGYDKVQDGYHFPNSQFNSNRCFNLYKDYVNEELEVIVTSGQLKIGITKSNKADSDWTVFDNFQLTYLGPVDISAYIEALNDAINDAQNLDYSNASTAVKNLIEEAISEAIAAQTSTDTDVLSQATAKLRNAINAADGMDVRVLQATIPVALAEGVDVTDASDAVENAMSKTEVDNALYELQTARKLNAQGFADVYTGATPTANQEYFLYNIGTGLWLNNGSDWNTHAAVDVYPLPVVLIAADGGKFKMQTHMFKNRDEKWINWGAYVDTGNQDTWTFNPVEGKENVYTINSEGNRTDVGRLLGYDPFGPTDKGSYLYWSTVAKDRENVNNPNNQWKLVTKAEIEAMMNTASTANPVDVSYLIDNGGLSRVWSLDYWTKVCDGGNGGAHIHVGDGNDQNNDNDRFNRNSDYGYEVWNANSFSFTQELNNLKPGIYQVGVSGFFRQGDGGYQASVINNGGELISEAYLEANGEKEYLPNIAEGAGKMPGIASQDTNNGAIVNWPAEALKAFQSGLYQISVQAIVNNDGKLTLGVKQDHKTTDSSWALFDSFRLYYLGEEPITTMSILGDFTGGFDFSDSQHMTQDSENPAIWTLTVDNFVVDLEGNATRTYYYKASANDKWGRYELPASGDQNWEFGSDMYPAGNYKLVFTVDTENHNLTLNVINKNVTIDENADYVAQDINDATITLKRTIVNGDVWNTFCVPFDISNADLKAAFGDDVQVAVFSEEADGENSTINFNTMATPAITANVPVLLKSATTATSFVFTGNVKAGEAKVAGQNFDFVGTFDASTTIGSGSYFLSNNKLYKSAGSTTIAATRAYLKVKTNGGARIVKLFFNDDSTTTAIDEVNHETTTNNSYYNLNGQRVTVPNKGMYIVNGKKVVINNAK